MKRLIFMLVVVLLSLTVMGLQKGESTACDEKLYPITDLAGNDAGWAFGCIDSTHARSCVKATGEVEHDTFPIPENHVLRQRCATSSGSSTSIGLRVVCQNGQRCQEIDEVWQLLGSFLTLRNEIVGKVYSPAEATWKEKAFVYPLLPGIATNFKSYNFGQRQFVETQYLPLVVEEAARQGIDPCYPLVTVLFESAGNANAIGNDANVVGCDVIGRRTLLLKRSEACKQTYLTSEALRDACLENAVYAENGFLVPSSSENACMEDFVDTTQFKLDTPAKEAFCSNTFDHEYLFGIGLGQITIMPKTSSTTGSYIMIGGQSYSHCDLFDPVKNIRATVTRLKEKGAAQATSESAIKTVLGSYVGAGQNKHGELRYDYFLACKNQQT